VLQDGSDSSTLISPPVVRDLLGYRLSREGELVWGFTSTGWREVLAGVAEARGIAAALADRQMLLVSASDRSHRYAIKVDGRPVMVYAIKASALES
jgi:putative DNA primase/helicase